MALVLLPLAVLKCFFQLYYCTSIMPRIRVPEGFPLPGAPSGPSMPPSPYVPHVPPVEKPIVHAANCDGCACVITGVRNKCLDCEDYDLCTDCLLNPDIRKVHDLKHSFFPIEIAADKAIFDAVQKARRGTILIKNIFNRSKLGTFWWFTCTSALGSKGRSAKSSSPLCPKWTARS